MLDAVPVSSPAVCEVVLGTSRNAKPCVVVVITEDNMASIGFGFENNDQVVLAGYTQRDYLSIRLVALSGEAPISTVGSCVTEYRVLTCNVVVQGVPLTIKATLK